MGVVEADNRCHSEPCGSVAHCKFFAFFSITSTLFVLDFYRRKHSLRIPNLMESCIDQDSNRGKKKYYEC